MDVNNKNICSAGAVYPLPTGIAKGGKCLHSEQVRHHALDSSSLPFVPHFLPGNLKGQLQKEVYDRLYECKNNASQRVMEMSKTSALVLRSVEGHPVQFYPNLFFSHCSKGVPQEILIDPLVLHINFSSPHSISKIDLKVRSIELYKMKTQMFQYDVISENKIKVEVKQTVEKGQYKVYADLEFQEPIKISMMTKREAKAVNGRSDENKCSLIDFVKKERFLVVNLDAAGLSCSFSTTVIACSSSSFNSALRTYRENVSKINELFEFLVKYPLNSSSRYEFTFQPDSAMIEREQVLSLDSLLSKLDANPKMILTFVEDHLADLTNAYLNLHGNKGKKFNEKTLSAKSLKWKKKWAEFISNGCGGKNLNDLAKKEGYTNVLCEIFTKRHFFGNLVTVLDSDLFCGGITTNLSDLVSGMKVFVKIKGCYPDGFATIVIGKGITDEFKDAWLYYLIEHGSTILYDNLKFDRRNLEENPHGPENVKVLAMVPSQIDAGIFNKLNINIQQACLKNMYSGDLYATVYKGLTIHKTIHKDDLTAELFKRNLKQTSKSLIISPNELVAYYHYHDIPLFNVDVHSSLNFYTKNLNLSSLKNDSRVMPKVNSSVREALGPDYFMQMNSSNQGLKMFMELMRSGQAKR